MFVPKNINKRADDLKRIQAKDLKEYEEFIKEFQQNLDLMKDKTSDDPKEQLFIDIIQDYVIKNDRVEYPFRIYLFKNDEYMFEYDWKNDTLYCSYHKVWSVFRDIFAMSYETWQQFITDRVETYFKFRPYTTFIRKSKHTS